ncbi:deoxynucleotidyltransferase terminal-interacting protein 1 isoform X2 [Cavia porcellus]|uniref:deoxynucleotidyltransferase terminal-interacting protein 1 isoform X2 n=1 Tax=Cavia porcellus TaxID=10141 RepID=UPI000661C9F7|nr:deoxynucleotidyltransferase terminal-interacting protein 1 isoform X2 [Cavia porcellus]
MGATGDVEQPRGPTGAERGGPELGDAGAAGQLVLTNPWNIMIKHRQVQRRGRRSQMTTSFTDPAISMDLLRAVLQPSINEEIQTVFNKYMKFFQKAAMNVRDNVGEEVDTEQLIQEACRSCLEQEPCLSTLRLSVLLLPPWPSFTSSLLPHRLPSQPDHPLKEPCLAKLLFSDGEKVIPRLAHELPGIKRGRLAEEECAHRGSPIPKKRKGRPPGHMLSSERAAAGMVWKPKSCEPIRREGPKWDPARLNEATTFVLGSRANKALGMGGTRGRIYIKHPHLFKYAADPQDKHWLAENHHMRATGGKMAYLLIEEDIRDLAASDDYRGCLDLKLDELKSFVLPSWIVEKMRKYMETLRTENEHHSAEAPGQT